MAKKKSSKKSTEKTGIRELVWVDPKSLDDNPLNWRKHPNRQKNAISASIKANGWSDTLTYNETTGKLIDGHARKSIAIRDGIESVPVLVGNWTEEQEKHLLATLDPLAAMAETDADALQSLTESLQEDTAQMESLAEKDQETLTQLTQELDTYAFNVSVGDDRKTFLPKQEIVTEIDKTLRHEGAESAFSFDLNIGEEVIFHSSNKWGIPDLLEDQLCETIPEMTWDRSDETVTPYSWFCQSARPYPEQREGGVLGFFTDDYRFECYWNNKTKYLEKLIDEEWEGVCSPDFSIHMDDPFVLQLYSIYRSRWLARFWQEAGIKIIPTIQGMSFDDSSNDWVLQTLPERVPVAAIQCRTVVRDISSKKFWGIIHRWIKNIVSIAKPKVLLIYGGIELKQKLGKLPNTKTTEFVLLDSYMTKRRHTLKEK